MADHAIGSRDLGVSHRRYAPNLRSPGAPTHREQDEDAPWPDET